MSSDPRSDRVVAALLEPLGLAIDVSGEATTREALATTLESLATGLDAERERDFWAQVTKLPGAGCWIWTGRTKMVFRAPAKPVTARRYVWCRNGRTIPKGKVLQSIVCGNAKCVRPDHMAVARPGRSGVKFKDDWRPNAKLTADHVVEIRRLYAAGGISMKDLAARFTISRETVWAIVNRVTWKHLPQPEDTAA